MTDVVIAKIQCTQRFVEGQSPRELLSRGVTQAAASQLELAQLERVLNERNQDLHLCLAQRQPIGQAAALGQWLVAAQQSCQVFKTQGLHGGRSGARR